MQTIAQVSPAQAKAKLEGMKRSLKGWLEYRQKVDAVASGKVPGKVAPQVLAAKLRADRFAEEDALAGQLYQLLAQVIDPKRLPSPDVEQDPNAAAKLAVIAIVGGVEGDQPAPVAQGGIGTIWPLALIAGVALVIMHGISSAADVAKEKEKTRCIQSGACTDSGFWVKAAALVGIAYVGYNSFVKPAGKARR